ncbi:AAA family ATPase [Candidatus Woesearchaeota archaeon]|nr:AAA family ATPase [Candidatus Woesearchaeota archaeon]
MTAKTIGVISINGGVGKTITTCNLGSALAELGKRVLLVDADFNSPNLALHFGIISPEKTLHHVFTDKATAYEAVHNYRENLDILPSSLIGEKINPYLLKEKLHGLRKMYDYILIDASPTLNDDMLATIVASDELVVVTSPDYPTLSATLNAVKVAGKKKTPIAGLVLNKVRGKKFELTPEEIEEASGVSILGVVRDDAHIPASVAGTKPMLEHKPRGRASKSFRQIAAALAEIDYDQSFFGSLRGWFQSRGQR